MAKVSKEEEASSFWSFDWLSGDGDNPSEKEEKARKKEIKARGATYADLAESHIEHYLNLMGSGEGSLDLLNYQLDSDGQGLADELIVKLYEAYGADEFGKENKSSIFKKASSDKGLQSFLEKATVDIMARQSIIKKARQEPGRQGTILTGSTNVLG